MRAGRVVQDIQPAVRAPSSPAIHLIDETFVVASAHRVRARWCDEQAWQRLLPGTTLTCFEDRGRRGKRWTLQGRLTGTAEVWLEALRTGILVHVYVRADPARRLRPGQLRRLNLRTTLSLKQFGFAVKDDAERARPAGHGRGQSSLAQQTG